MLYLPEKPAKNAENLINQATDSALTIQCEIGRRIAQIFKRIEGRPEDSRVNSSRKESVKSRRGGIMMVLPSKPLQSFGELTRERSDAYLIPD
jgi:hypothetical protein